MPIDKTLRAKANYFDIYNLAPVGYLILNSKGTILNANLKAATMLGMRYDRLLKNLLAVLYPRIFRTATISP